MHVCVCVHVCVYICECVHVCVHVLVFMCMLRYVCIWIHARVFCVGLGMWVGVDAVQEVNNLATFGHDALTYKTAYWMPWGSYISI